MIAFVGTTKELGTQRKSRLCRTFLKHTVIVVAVTDTAAIEHMIQCFWTHFFLPRRIQSIIICNIHNMNFIIVLSRHSGYLWHLHFTLFIIWLFFTVHCARYILHKRRSDIDFVYFLLVVPHACNLFMQKIFLIW